MLQPEIRHSADEIKKLLAEEFIEFGSSGRIYDLQAIIDELEQETDLKIAMTDFKTTPLSQNIVLATYRAVCHDEPDGPAIHSLRSSIWKLTGDTWQMVFHQGTPTSAP